jgi:pimeloyl-ACP methyl ester carboxylesterase
MRLEELLATAPKDAGSKDRNFQEVYAILSRYGPNEQKAGMSDPNERVLPQDLGGTLSQIPFGVIKEKLKSSSQDLFRVFTYWQMKQRAGTVGETGVHAMIGRLQQEFPSAKMHLIGHSFGCKVVLSAIRGIYQAPLPRPVDSVVLIQAAVSYQSFAGNAAGSGQPGGYRIVLDRAMVNGPIVATFSSSDVLLRDAYPLASLLGRQTGATEALPGAGVFDKYAALGGKGFDALPEITMTDPGMKYGFDQGLKSINANNGIDGHSAIMNSKVAWLIWCATMRQ